MEKPDLAKSQERSPEPSAEASMHAEALKQSHGHSQMIVTEQLLIHRQSL
jgi:hypothetical protein